MRRREELPVARDSHVNEDEELTSLHRLRGHSAATSTLQITTKSLEKRPKP